MNAGLVRGSTTNLPPPFPDCVHGCSCVWVLGPLCQKQPQFLLYLQSKHDHNILCDSNFYFILSDFQIFDINVQLGFFCSLVGLNPFLNSFYQQSRLVTSQSQPCSSILSKEYRLFPGVGVGGRAWRRSRLLSAVLEMFVAIFLLIWLIQTLVTKEFFKS